MHELHEVKVREHGGSTGLRACADMHKNKNKRGLHKVVLIRTRIGDRVGAMEVCWTIPVICLI